MSKKKSAKKKRHWCRLITLSNIYKLLVVVVVVAVFTFAIFDWEIVAFKCVIISTHSVATDSSTKSEFNLSHKHTRKQKQRIICKANNNNNNSGKKSLFISKFYIFDVYLFCLTSIKCQWAIFSYFKETKKGKKKKRNKNSHNDTNDKWQIQRQQTAARKKNKKNI